MENKNKKALVGNERETREESKHAKNNMGKELNHDKAGSKSKSAHGENSVRHEDVRERSSRNEEHGKDKSHGQLGHHDKSKSVKK